MPQVTCLVVEVVRKNNSTFALPQLVTIGVDSVLRGGSHEICDIGVCVKNITVSR